MEPELLGEMHKRIVQNFLDIVILQELNKRPLHCYDIISQIYNKHYTQLSSGKTYSRLFALERDGLVKSELNSNKRIFNITQRGKERVRELSMEKTRILGFFLDLFEGK